MKRNRTLRPPQVGENLKVGGNGGQFVFWSPSDQLVNPPCGTAVLIGQGKDQIVATLEANTLLLPSKARLWPGDLPPGGMHITIISVPQ